MSTPPPPPPGFNSPGYGAPQQVPPPPGGVPQYGAPQYSTPQQPYGAPPPGYQPYVAQGYGGGREYAGIGARLGARLLDGLIAIIFLIPAGIAFFVAPRHYVDCTVNGESGICRTPNAAGWAIIVLLWVIGAIAYLVIYCKKMGSGQTWGEKATSIRVVGKDTNEPIGTGRAVGRFFAQYLSGAVCYLGFFWALWDKDKQTWHDKIVNTVVIKA